MKFHLKFIKVTIFSFISTLVLGSGVFGVYSYFFKEKDSIVNANYAFDPNEKEELVGFSSNVFVGTVIKKETEYPDEPLPLTSYQVQVDENIKGNLTGQVNVLQRIGYDENTNTTIKFENDEFLSEGEQYLFSTNEKNEFNGYIISTPVFGNELLTKTNEDQVVSEFIVAEENEVDPMEEIE